MGLMENPAAGGRLIVTPHPVLVDGQRNQPADLRPGESLYAFLMRHVDELDGRAWQVTIGGRDVPRHLWHHVRPKHGQVIEARGAVGRSAVALVATLALAYFTFGGGAIAGFSIGTSTVAGTYAAQAAVYMAGSLLINRVLQPKQPKASPAAPSVHSISAGRNRARPHEPLGFLFGSVRIAPDLASNPYTWYEGDDQFLSMVLTPGLNVDSVEALYNGDALLSSYDGVRVWHNGFPGMPSQDIPLYSNADVAEGGTLLDTSNDPKHQASAWVQRTSSANTVRLMVGAEFQIWDRTTKGKDKLNQDQIQIQYRAVGATAWQAFGTYNIKGNNNKQQRASYAIDVAEGQYDVRVRVVGNNTDGSGAEANVVWTTLTSVQRDTATYAGISRIGIRMQANGQLNGAPDEIRCVAHALPIPVWKGDAIGWVTERTSNPGAQILAFARGVYVPDALAPGGYALVAGMGLPDRQIDIEGLKAFMLHCETNGFTYDYWLTEVRSHQQVLDNIALAGFGQISWPRGRLSVGWAADEQPLSGVVNMATIKKGQFHVDYTLANAADGIEYSYLDRNTWEVKTLRVPAPGVITMLNPAQVTGEGITNEAHGAMLARWHLAQSLYQYKSIGYSTDIEHLSYSRMSMLALQHDMTQWGFGGRVMAASLLDGKMVLQLDEPVPAPAQGNAFVGVRIPGERVYRVMRVQPFVGTAKELTLADAWPADAAVPGDSEANPAWDTLWIYDFKQTPGLRVRVVGIRPESDLKGAAVEVVAESAEFWHFVKTGEYIPSPNESLLQTRPVASDLKVTERQVVQGDTEYTELQATFAVSGPVGDTVVLSDTDGNAALEEVARTVTRTATWRIPGAGTYPITVRPYSPEGNAGVAVSLIYTTRGADAPPVLVDLFDVEQLSGGVRRYTWGFFSDTIQSANFAGVEIRYIAGTVAQPNWDAMSPLGDDGYHSAAFEAVLPEAGTWTFACRSRNTSGTLSTGMQVVTKTLTANLGEVIGGIEDSIDEQTQKQVEQQQQIDRDRADSIARDAAEAAQRAADYAQAQADLINESALRTAAVKQVADNLVVEVNARAAAVQDLADDMVAVAEAVSAEESARIDAMLNEKLERQAEITVERTARQTLGESLAQQIGMVAAGSGTQFDSRAIWHFNTSVEGWTGGSNPPTVVDGMLRPGNSTSAYGQTPNNLAIDGDAFRFIKTRVRQIGTPPWRGLVRWITDADTNWNDAKSLTIPAPSFDANGLATVDIDLIPWNSGSPVRAVRMALVTTQTDTDYLMYDYVGIGRPSPGASTAMVQDAVTALTNADVAEATQRTALGVQMRGNYTGSDASAAQGMIGQVNTARIEGDQVLAERSRLIEVRLPAGNGKLASEASVTAVEQASVARDAANADAVTAVNAALPAIAAQGGNKVTNGGWQFGQDVGWSYASNRAGMAVVDEGRTGKCWRVDGAAGTRAAYANGGADMDVIAGKTYRVSFWYRTTDDYNGTSDNGKMRLGNQTGGLLTSATFGASRLEWTYRDFTYTVPTDGSVTAFRLSALANNTAGTLWVDDVAIEEVTELLANAQATQGLSVAVTNLEGTVAAHSVDLTQVRSDVAGKASAAGLQALDTKVAQQGNELTSQAGQLTQLQSGVSAAQQAAQDAAAAAGGKGKVIFQSAAPATADRLSQNLWIDTTGNAFTPKRWNGTAWVAVTDKVATDAAAAAAAAQAASSANAAAISSTNTRVAQAEGKIESHGTSITRLDNSVQALEGAFTAIPNGTFDLDTSYWVDSGGGSSFNWDAGEKALRSGAGSVRVANDTPISINPGDTVKLTFRTRSSDNMTSVAAATAGFISSLGSPTNWTQSWANWAATTAGEWVSRSYTWNVPSTFNPQTVYVRFAIGTINPTASAYVLIDDVVVQTPGTIGDLQNRVTANAQNLSALTNTVSVQGGTISTLSASINQLLNEVAGKASSAALQALDSRVEIAEGAIESQGSALTQVQGRLGTLDSAVAANTAATSGLNTKITSLEGTVASQGTAVTNVQADIAAANVALDRAQRSGSNMVVDGSFENRPLGTALQSWATIVTGGRTGSQCLQVGFNSVVRSTTLQTFDITPDRVYYAEAWVKRVGPAAGSMSLRFNASENGASPTYPNFATVNLSAMSETEWTKVSGYLRVAAGKNRGSLQLNSSAGTTSATTLLWDDFVLMDVTEAYSAQQTATAAASAASTLDGRVTLIDGVLAAQGQAVTRVEASTAAADTKAANAQSAADAAATAAGNKGKVIYGTATPGTADRLSQNLWIDTTGNANTPKRWNGTSWVAVTDKAATDAAAAAAAAKSTADATAVGLSATDARVTSAEGTLSAHTTQINSANAAIAGKANASAVIELDAKVNGTIAGGGNKVVNASIAVDARGWMVESNGGWESLEFGRDVMGRRPDQSNEHSVGIYSPKSKTANACVVYSDQYLPVDPDSTVFFSAWIAAYGYAEVAVGMKFQTAAGEWAGEPVSAWVRPPDEDWGSITNGWQRHWVKSKVPSNATKAKVGLWVRTALNNSFAGGFMTRPMLEVAHPDQVYPSPFSTGGNEDHASIGFYVDVNGNLAGMQVKSDGTTGEINMLADVLNIISPGGVDGLELRDGYLRVWKGGAQRIIGNGFGQQGDLMDYFGPNVGAGGASKANATMWMDIEANAYWGGSLSAGTLKNAVQTTSTLGNAEIVNGPFDTLGRPKNVTVSYSFTKRDTANNGTWSNVGGSTNAVINIYRKVGNGAETLVTALNVTGDHTVFNEQGGPSYLTSRMSGSTSFVDNTPGTEQFTYRAALVSRNSAAGAASGGTINTSTNQTLGIISVEQ